MTDKKISKQYASLRAVQEVAERCMAACAVYDSQLTDYRSLFEKATLMLSEFIIPWMSGEEIAAAERQVAGFVANVSVGHELEDLYGIVYINSMACGVLWDDLSEDDQNRVIFGLII